MAYRKLSMTALLLAGSALALAGCSSKGKPSHVPAEYFQGTSLTRNAVTPRPKTEYLEINLNPIDSQLRQSEIAAIKGFLREYNTRGHGPLIMSVPKGAPNPQLAISAAAETREIAWQSGVEYDQIAGSAYNVGGRQNAPIILAFKAYEAVAPACPQLYEIDFANAVSNSDLPTLGCSVRTNLAAMIADPADLYGDRVLEAGDNQRRETMLETWREGGQTSAERGDAESGAISTAVN